jgi:hypothetical protein
MAGALAHLAESLPAETVLAPVGAGAALGGVEPLGLNVEPLGLEQCRQTLAQPSNMVAGIPPPHTITALALRLLDVSVTATTLPE